MDNLADYFIERAQRLETTADGFAFVAEMRRLIDRWPLTPDQRPMTPEQIASIQKPVDELEQMMLSRLAGKPVPIS